MVNKNKILTYGSLRKGEYNYDRFKEYFKDGLQYESTITIKGFDLFDLGSYPGIKVSENPEKELVVDIMNCDLNCFNDINGMERGAGYSSHIININNREHIIYIYEGTASKLVESGDWSKYLKELK